MAPNPSDTRVSFCAPRIRQGTLRRSSLLTFPGRPGTQPLEVGNWRTRNQCPLAARFGPDPTEPGKASRILWPLGPAKTRLSRQSSTRSVDTSFQFHRERAILDVVESPNVGRCAPGSKRPLVTSAEGAPSRVNLWLLSEFAVSQSEGIKWHPPPSSPWTGLNKAE